MGIEVQLLNGSMCYKMVQSNVFFCQRNVDPCHFVCKNYTTIVHVNNCLVFYKNNKVLNELIDSSQGKFNLTDEGNLEKIHGNKNH